MNKPKWDAHNVHAGTQKRGQQRRHRWHRRRTNALIRLLLSDLGRRGAMREYVRA